MQYDLSFNSEKNKNIGMILTTAFHVIVLLLLLIPYFKFDQEPKLDGGILVALGLPDEGQGDDLPETQPNELVEELTKPNATEANAVKSTSPDKDKQTTNVKTEVAKVQEIKTIDENSNVAIADSKKKKEAEEATKLADKRRREADLKAQQEAQRKADEDAKKQAELDAKKKQFGTLFGKGQGNTGKEGSQGDPKGDPNSKVLESLAKGSGRIGGGLSNRGVVSEPKFSDKSQKTGRVVIAICVDKNGVVSEANFTQKGSTTTDSELVAIAKKGALKYKFAAGEAESQCGTVTVDFKIQ